MADSQSPKSIEEMGITASYVLTIGQVRWIESEAARIKSLPNAPKKFNKSVLVRQIIDRAMSQPVLQAEVA